MPWGTPLTLIGESAEQVADAQRMLVRIGIDELAGQRHRIDPELSAGAPTVVLPTAHLRRATGRPCGRRAATDDDAVLLDVRRDDEHATGLIPGAAHVPAA